MSKQSSLHPGLKLALELGPLVLFFVVYARWDFFTGTAVFMVAVLIALVVSYALTRRLPIMAIVSGVIVMVFGGLTLVLHDETFVKMKPTIVYALFGAILTAGLLLRKPVLEVVFDSVFNLTEEGWRKLTVRWALFFFCMAVLNEIVWRTQTTTFWFSFKLVVAIPLTFLFAALQYPLLMKHEASPEAKQAKES